MPFKSLLGIGLAGGLTFLSACGNANSFSGSGSEPNASFAKAIEAADIDGDDFVEVCHTPPGNPDNRHTIVVGAAAAEQHLRHGDVLGVCADDDSADSILLTVDAGADFTVIGGDDATLTGTVMVVAGDFDPADAVLVWEQVDGPTAATSSDVATMNVETNGLEGELTFRLTASTPNGSASASDEVVVTVVPPEIVAVVSAKWHNVALWNNGKISGWGWNRYGQLGDGSIDDDVVSVDGGLKHTVVAKTDGTVWTFGQNALSSSAVPVQVPGVADAVQVAALHTGVLALDGQGTVWGLSDGLGDYCDLAESVSLDVDGAVVAVEVLGLPEHIVAISAGGRHALALDSDGTAWVWGSRFGCTPWAVMNNVAQVAAGTSDSCIFRLNDGTVWSMGFNLHGQLGNGTMISNYDTPEPVVGLSGIVDVAVGDRHTGFLGEDGTLYMAGWNRYCQLGLEDEVDPVEREFGADNATPIAIAVGDFALISGGSTHSLGVHRDNSLWGWGLNTTGQLSGGTLTDLPGTVCMPLAIELPESE